MWRIIALAAYAALGLGLSLPPAAGQSEKGPLPAGDWPHWRGPYFDGVSRETGLLKEWPDGGPRVLWKVKLSGGYSSVAVAGGPAIHAHRRGTRRKNASLPWTPPAVRNCGTPPTRATTTAMSASRRSTTAGRAPPRPRMATASVSTSRRWQPDRRNWPRTGERGQVNRRLRRGPLGPHYGRGRRPCACRNAREEWLAKWAAEHDAPEEPSPQRAFSP